MKQTLKPLMIIILLLAFLASSAGAVERKRFGIGVIAGEPTGITGKFGSKKGQNLFGFVHRKKQGKF